jgi:hypothetical protein
MIIVKIWGGLGNQMFQYAFGKVLSQKNGSELKLDTSHFSKVQTGETLRPFKLSVFPLLEYTIATNEDIRRCVKEFRFEFLNKLYKKINALFPSFNKYYVTEGSVDIIKNGLTLNEAVYLEGYWQSEDYFADYRDEIIKCFKLEGAEGVDELLGQVNEITELDSVSIHIRRGDYVTNKQANFYHGVCSLDYYENSVLKITDKLKSDKLKFFIFSDDIDWCKQNLKLTNPHEYVVTNEDYHDMYLMSRCKHNIIANSSFSWWAAWLNENSSKIVIAPKNWFVNTDVGDLLPKTWLKI